MLFSVAEQFRYELTSVLKGYPSFVLNFGGRLQDSEVPVFVFHTIEPNEFEGHLLYLKRNGYHTIDLDQFVNSLQTQQALPPKSVLLTIDDARSSVWRFGYPLLKRHNMKATVFAIPGYTQPTSENNDNLQTLGDTNEHRQHLKNLDPQDHGLCSWEQLREMAQSGLINIESHSLFHREVFTDPTICGWVDQTTKFVTHDSPVTAYLDFKDLGTTLEPEQFYGLPLFKSSALLAGKPALIIPESVKTFCRERYGRQSHEDTLRELAASGLLDEIGVQTQAEMEAVIEQDLSVARELIQQQISPDMGQHLCLPFTHGCPLVIDIAHRIGLQSCSWGTIPGKRINSVSSEDANEAMHLVRLKSDFIPRLPGKQRLSLIAIYLNKVIRRLQGQPVY